MIFRTFSNISGLYLGWEDPLGEVLLPGESRGQRSLLGCRPQGRKEWTRLSHLACRQVVFSPVHIFRVTGVNGMEQAREFHHMPHRVSMSSCVPSLC